MHDTHRSSPTRLNHILNLICLPLRLILSHDTVSRLGLMSVLEERMVLCSRHTTGVALDIGAGRGNLFIRTFHPNGIGCDVLAQPEVDVVADAQHLPFRDGSFDTVLYISSYLYLDDKVQGLNEARRVLRPNGRVLLLSINPILCWLRHKTAWWDNAENVHYPKGALWHGTLLAQFKAAGLRETKSLRYLAGLAKLYVLTKGTPSG